MVLAGPLRPTRMPTIIYLSWLLAGVAAVFVVSGSVAALTSIVQAYKIAKTPPIGSIVSLQSSASDTVLLANTKNVNNLFGVTVPESNALLSLSSGTGNQVQVATSGVTTMLVSDINGPIKTGDEITSSPVDGVGMKATENVKVIGVAQENLGDSPGKSKSKYTDENKQQHSIVIGQIPTLVNVSYYYKQPDKTLIPSVIQNIANTVAGKKVSPLPIIICLVIFLVSLISIFSLIYAAIRSSIISVGRNPMSQSAVYRSLLQVTVLVLFIAGVAVTAIFLILTRI